MARPADAPVIVYGGLLYFGLLMQALVTLFDASAPTPTPPAGSPPMPVSRTHAQRMPKPEHAARTTLGPAHALQVLETPTLAGTWHRPHPANNQAIGIWQERGEQPAAGFQGDYGGVCPLVVYFAEDGTTPMVQAVIPGPGLDDVERVRHLRLSMVLDILGKALAPPQ